MTRRSLLVHLSLLVLLNGCAFTVHETWPKPNVDLPTSKGKLRLRLDDSIKNDITVPGQNMWDTEISLWRRSLHNGFANAFGDAFEGGEPTRTLVILEAAPSFVSTVVAVTSHGTGARPAAVAAQIRYKARLIDSNGKILARSKGTVLAKNSITNREYAPESMQSALESMYEKIAADVFGDGSDSEDE